MKNIKFTFFFSWSIGFLLITLIGFVPTFLFRPLFRDTDLPQYLIIHGVLMMMWFFGYFYQNLLTSTGKLVNHKKFGSYLFLLAILMAIGNFNVVLHLSNEILTGTPTYFGPVRTY